MSIFSIACYIIVMSVVGNEARREWKKSHKHIENLMLEHSNNDNNNNNNKKYIRKKKRKTKAKVSVALD